VVCAVARQLTNCHRQLLAIRFIPERPRSVYVVRRGMINQRRVASRRIRVASRRVASRRVGFARSFARGEYRIDDRQARPQHGRLSRIVS